MDVDVDVDADVDANGRCCWLKQYLLQFERRSLPQRPRLMLKLLRDPSFEPHNTEAKLNSLGKLEY